MPKLGFYKLYHDVHSPEFATDGSACFDLRAVVSKALPPLRGFCHENEKFLRKNAQQDFVVVQPGDTIMIPTGLIFDIPSGYSVRLHARSGLSLKKKLVLANAEGVIDSDYVEEVKVLLYNASTVEVVVENGQRICQAELVKNVPTELINIEEKPTQKTNRVGGFGSTGEK